MKDDGHDDNDDDDDDDGNDYDEAYSPGVLKVVEATDLGRVGRGGRGHLLTCSANIADFDDGDGDYIDNYDDEYEADGRGHLWFCELATLKERHLQRSCRLFDFPTRNESLIPSSVDIHSETADNSGSAVCI